MTAPAHGHFGRQEPFFHHFGPTVNTHTTSVDSYLAARPSRWPVAAVGADSVPRVAEHHRLVESLRVVLAIIAGLLLIEVRPGIRNPLFFVEVAFSFYAIALLWQAANGSANAQRRLYYWLDAAWFLLFLALAGEARTQFFLLLFFPIFFAAWRTGYRESIAIAAFSALSALVILALGEPGISLARLLALPLSLFVVGPLFVALARVETASRQNLAFIASIVEHIDSRRGFDAIIPEVITRIGEQLGATAVLLAFRTFEGRSRVFCWEAGEEAGELSDSAASPFVERTLALAGNAAFGWAAKRGRRKGERLIRIGQDGIPVTPSADDRAALAALVSLVDKPRLVVVPVAGPGIGHIRLIVAGESVAIDAPALTLLLRMTEQIGPSVENAYLREQLATEAADTERARIGRDLHDSAIQPYIGLKFALEALKHRVTPDNPLAPDIANLVDMATTELAAMREVVSGLRGAPGKGGALLSNAVRRQAARFGQLFGIGVDVTVVGDMPVSRRVAGEIFHIVAEGLSNIRRHTQARQAWISLAAIDDMLILKITNENDPHGLAADSFFPRSLSERAASLQGSAEVERSATHTAVTVRVPIPQSHAQDSAHER